MPAGRLPPGPARRTSSSLATVGRMLIMDANCEGWMLITCVASVDYVEWMLITFLDVNYMGWMLISSWSR